MKTRIVKLVLRKKVNEWIKSIGDTELQELVKNNCIVTGGAIASLLMNEPVNDFDIYFTNKDVVKKVAEYYITKFKKQIDNKLKTKDIEATITVEDLNDRIKINIESNGQSSDDLGDVEFISLAEMNDSIFEENVVENIVVTKDGNNKGLYHPIFLSPNAITLSDDVQLILRFYGDAAEIHSNYDFAHCTNYWESENNNLVLHPKAIECLLVKELKYVGSKYPLASLVRTRKFIQRGFSCSAGEYLKMCWQVNQLDLTDIKVLEDQLSGVDSAYFKVLLDVLENKMEEEDFVLEYDYICELIDKIF